MAPTLFRDHFAQEKFFSMSVAVRLGTNYIAQKKFKLFCSNNIVESRHRQFLDN